MRSADASARASARRDKQRCEKARILSGGPTASEGKAMKVREVIALLQQQDQEAECVVNLERNERANGKPVVSVLTIPAMKYHANSESWLCDYYPEIEPEEGEVRQLVVNITS
jgi:hypothetical protein